MVNQNPEPIVLSENLEIQAGDNSGDVELTHEMASPEMMDLFAVYIYIYPGYLDIGPDGDYPAPATRHTYTDINPIYIPVINNPNRPDDHEAENPFFVTLPVCCNPRTWTDLTLEIRVNNNPVPSKIINIGVINAKLDRTIPFSTPIKLKWNQRLYIRVQNNNPATPTADTFSKVDIVLNGEITNYEQLRLEQKVAQDRA